MKTIYKELFNLVSLINNGYQRKHLEIFTLKTNFILDFLKILKNNGFILSYKVEENTIKIYLNINSNIFYNIKPLSKRSINQTFSYDELKLLRTKIKSNIFLLFITNKGLLSLDEIISLKIGGKLLLQISEI